MSQIAKAQAQYETFAQQFNSVIISTINRNSIPNASYTPFVMDEAKNIYIYVSGLATHTQNLKVNPLVSVLFIDDESQTQEIFARRRLSFDCTATLMERDTQTWNHIVDQFHERFGEIIPVLRGLADFQIFCLTPRAGRFVIGFGRAYEISGDKLNQLVHINDNE